jgi:hypothetical protein
MVRVFEALRRPIIVVGLVAFGAATLVAVLVVKPAHLGSVGYDAAASVLYFQRITSGTRLEAFVGATPKPLLTILYGLAYAIFHDWRAITWLAISGYALGIALATALAHRVAGPSGAAFAAVGLMGSAGLLLDLDLAYAVPWALVSWAAAGLLVTSSRPRYAWAGVVLGLGALARAETLIVVGLAGVAIVLSMLQARRAGRPITTASAGAPILLGLMALPVQALHDWLLTGDPTYTERVPVLGSAGARLMDVGGAIRFLAEHYASEPLLLLGAALGLLVLVAHRRWALALGTIALGPGIGAFILFLAASGIYVSARYVTPGDLGLTFAAAVGVSSLRMAAAEPLIGRLTGSASRAFLATAAGALVALLLVRPFGPLDRNTQTTIAQNARVERDLADATPAMASAIADDPAAAASPVDGSPTTKMGAAAHLLVPVLTVPQLAVDLRLPLSFVAGTDGATITTDGSYPRPGQLVLHQIDRDLPAPAFTPFDISVPTRVGSLSLRPLFVRAGQIWLIRVEH